MSPKKEKTQNTLEFLLGIIILDLIDLLNHMFLLDFDWILLFNCLLTNDLFPYFLVFRIKLC